MNKLQRTFSSENELARFATRAIRQAAKPIDSSIKIKTEVRAPGAVPDLVLFSKKHEAIRYVVTFEFKLSNWRQAILQAFRHRNFGNEAYVLLDQERAAGAVQHLQEFERANVGLATIDREARVHIWHYPTPAIPFSSQFAESLAAVLVRTRNKPKIAYPFIRTTRGGLRLSGLKNSLSAIMDSQMLDADRGAVGASGQGANVLI